MWPWAVGAHRQNRMAVASHLPTELARALISLRQFGAAAIGNLEHAACGGGCRQARSYRTAPAYLEGRDWRDRPLHRPRVYESPGKRDKKILRTMALCQCRIERAALLV